MNDIITAIKEAAEQEGVEYHLLLALCTVESSLTPTAIRFEPNYKWVYQTATFAKKLNISQDTETACQRFSYGLGQVMGAVCREYGFTDHLMELFSNYRLSLKYSAKHLAKYLKANKGNVENAVASYNAGSVRKTATGQFENQAYVDKVMKEFHLLSLSKK